MNEPKITPEFAEWFGAWIGDGDHSPHKKSVTLCNQEHELLQLHIKILTEYFNFPRERVLVEVTTGSSDDIEIIKKRWATKLSLPYGNIRTINRNPVARKECARVVANNVKLIRFLRDNTTAIKLKISNSTKETKAAYVRGIFAAEGSIRKGFAEKHVRLAMLSIEDVAFVQKLLENIEISSRINFNPHNGAYELSLYGYENLLNFKNLGGFGRHKDKNAILHYQLKYTRIPWSFKFKRLKEILKNKNVITNKEAAKIFNTTYHNAKFMLATFARRGMLNVDKTNKTHYYGLNESV